jgi:hypothetical protein|tara:strand:- start:1152 stop:1289 length:138 start_codon:yes stop_codon:yes gene_type:complete
MKAYIIASTKRIEKIGGMAKKSELKAQFEALKGVLGVSGGDFYGR